MKTLVFELLLLGKSRWESQGLSKGMIFKYPGCDAPGKFYNITTFSRTGPDLHSYPIFK